MIIIVICYLGALKFEKSEIYLEKSYKVICTTSPCIERAQGITYRIFFISAIVLVFMVSLVYGHCVGGAEDSHHFSHVDMDSCS